MSNLKFEINERLKSNAAFCSFVSELPQRFAEGGETVYNKRNVIKIFDFNGQKVVVKRFKKLNALQRVVYSFFRPSKAERAYRNAIELQKREVATPEALAYVEEWSGGTMVYGYYISAADFSAPIDDLLNHEDGSFDMVLAECFGLFVANLHKKGVLHHDLNCTNVLFQPTENARYSFSLIDINRMQFSAGRPSDANCYENLTRYTGNLELFRYVAEVYAKDKGGDVPQTVADMMEVKRRHDLAWVRRKKFTRKLKSLFKKK